MEREVKNKKLLKVTNNFEDICNSKNFKFKYLDDWLYTKSKILKKRHTLINRKNTGFTQEVRLCMQNLVSI